MVKINLLLLLLFAISCNAQEQRIKLKKKDKYTNALIRETSPYLLQHAHNPVDWYP